jgi:hypothetical protein
VDRKIIALIVVVLIVLVLGVYIFATQNTFNNLTANNTTNTTNTSQIAVNNNSSNNSSGNNTTNVKVSAAQAQAIAIGAAKELGGNNDTAGTPTLFKWTQNKLHTWVWNVPLFDAVTKKSDGAMYVDAETGEVIMNE